MQFLKKLSEFTIKICFQKAKWQQTNIGLSNDLASNRQQAITRINDALFQRPIYASQSVNKMDYLMICNQIV